jgi:hypothetical protein
VTAFGLLQTLYAFDETDQANRLVGVAMFTRESRSSLVILHLAAHEDYTSQGKWADGSVVAHLVDAIRVASLRTHGIRTLRILYPHEIRLTVRNRRHGSGASRPVAKPAQHLS